MQRRRDRWGETREGDVQMALEIIAIAACGNWRSQMRLLARHGGEIEEIRAPYLQSVSDYKRRRAARNTLQ